MSDAIVRDGQTARAWYQPTIGKFLFALFAIEIALYASEQYRWFEFNRHKNWTVLVNVAVVAVGLLLVLLWVAGAALFKRRPQFALSTLMGLVFVVGLACGWLSNEIANTRSQEDIKKEFASLGLSNAFKFVGNARSPTETLKWEGVHFIGLGLSAEFSTDAHTPPILHKWFGDDFFSSLKNVTFCPNDEDEAQRGVEALSRISDLRELFLHGPRISDATLSRLGELPKLESLTINGASISNDGLRHVLLQKNLRAIGLHSVSVDDVGLGHLEDLKYLNSLDVRRVSITDTALIRLANLKRMKSLVVEDTLVTDEGLSQIHSDLPHCRIAILSLNGSKLKILSSVQR